MVDLSGQFGERVASRLAEERIIWLITVDGMGRPQPRPVWFLWDGESIWIYSRPNTAKIGHLRSNPQVALHMDGDGQGGDIVVILGEAKVDQDAPPADQYPAYVEKYDWGFKRLGLSAGSFAERYSVAIRVKPLSLRGH